MIKLKNRWYIVTIKFAMCFLIFIYMCYPFYRIIYTPDNLPSLQGYIPDFYYFEFIVAIELLIYMLFIVTKKIYFTDDYIIYKRFFITSIIPFSCIDRVYYHYDYVCRYRYDYFLMNSKNKKVILRIPDYYINKDENFAKFLEILSRNSKFIKINNKKFEELAKYKKISFILLFHLLVIVFEYYV